MHATVIAVCSREASCEMHLQRLVQCVSSLCSHFKRTAIPCTDDERLMQVYDYEYDLILRPDINTRGHTQWFYFSVSNTVHNVPYKFNIINMVKSDSLYQDGMQPLVFSEKEAVAHGKMWKRSGSNISYYQVRP